ncbi:Myelin transcription factor-like protein [Hirschfeldia incana]|nr:Myelin transcription factor-like protein [Hirschfeldia incana]
MNTTKEVFDVSPFLLLESSADSDTYHGGDDQIEGAPDGEPNVNNNDYADRDDIDESCTANSYKTSSMTTWRPSFDPEDTVKEEIILTGGEEEDEDGEVNSYIIRYRTSQHENTTVDSSPVLTEMDKSRMFWEACLAS